MRIIRSFARNRSAGVRASIASTRVRSTPTGSSRGSRAAARSGTRDIRRVYRVDPVQSSALAGLTLPGPHPPYTRTTTFPRACPPSMWRSAAAVPESGTVRSITGLSSPASTISFRTTRSSWFGIDR